MDKKRTLISRWLKYASVLFLCIFITAAFFEYITNLSFDENVSTPFPTPVFVAPQVIHPQMVTSTWSHETIFSAHRFEFPEWGGWLAVNSKGLPALAYGGSQLNYAWYDGTKWHIQEIDLRPGAGKYAHLLFDANDQPHIVYGIGGLQGFKLETMYQDAQGWHRQDIDPGSCFSGNLDLAYNAQGSLLVAYDANPSCGGFGTDISQIRLASQKPNGWQIETISKTGIYASLAVDRQGRIHIAYQDTRSYALVETVRPESGDWVSSVILKHAPFPTEPIILIDANLYTHIIYSNLTSDDSKIILYHTWMDETGWHSEQAKYIANPTGIFSAATDSDGQIYVLYSDGSPRMMRRNATSWQEVGPSDIGIGNYSAITLIIDQNKQLRLAYFASPQYTVNYAVQQDGRWQKTEVDRGNAINISPAAMAFDQAGKLHISFRDDQRAMNYLSQGPAGWDDDVVNHVGLPDYPRSIQLLFDDQNHPHIFYSNGNAPTDRIASGLIHAYQGASGWTTERVPLMNEDDFPVRSPVIISPEGWPALVQCGFTNSFYIYRSPGGWNVQNLPYIKKGIGYVSPQIVFQGGAAQFHPDKTSDLPDVFYYASKSNDFEFSSPGQSSTLVVPMRAAGEESDRISLIPSNQESPVFISYYLKESTQGNEIGLRFGTYQKGFWQTYQMDGVYEYDPLIDASGSISMVSTDEQLYYITGIDPNWKKTEIPEWTLTQPPELILVGTALSPDGKFCVLLEDYTANSLVLECLASLK